MTRLFAKKIRLKNKEGVTLYPELGYKTVTREKLIEGDNIPIILTLTPVENDFNNGNPYDRAHYYVEGINEDNLYDYILAYRKGTPIFLKYPVDDKDSALIPVTGSLGNNTFNFIATMFRYKSPSIDFYGILFYGDKAYVSIRDGNTYYNNKFLAKGDINGLNYAPISFDPHSDYTTETVPPNGRMYYYDQNAKSSGKPKYSMGVHGNVIFNLDLPRYYQDSDTVSYHIELWEYMSGRRIRFPEHIEFQITPISTYSYNGGSTEDSALQPEVNIDSNYTEITVTEGDTGEGRNYHMIIDIFFNGKYYLGTIKVIPMVEGNRMLKNSKIKFVFVNDEGSYSDIVPSSGTIGDDGLLYTNKAGEFTYTYKGTKYTPDITIDKYNPINRVIVIEN